MKKSLIALAVLAASGAAMAQSSVTIYGLADVWMGSNKVEITGTDFPAANGKASNSVLNSNGFSTSRLGFKGSEDLGGGLKANFTIETRLAPDAPGATRLGDRVAMVGLSGGFGSVELGKNWSPYDDTRAMANDTFNANIASSFQTWVGYEDNPANQIRYNTPSFGGLSGSFAYGFGEDKTAAVGSKASSITAMSLNYANGPIVAGLAYQQQKDNGTGIGFDALPGFLFNEVTTDPAIQADFAAAVNNSKTTYTLINGSYDFGVAKLVAGYNTVKVTEPGVAGNLKANEYNIGVEAPLGANLAVAVGYAQSKLKDNGVEFGKTTGYSLAAKYNLSKRTFAYAALTQVKYKSVPDATAFTLKNNIAAVGIQHSF